MMIMKGCSVTLCLAHGATRSVLDMMTQGILRMLACLPREHISRPAGRTMHYIITTTNTAKPVTLERGEFFLKASCSNPMVSDSE